MEQPCPSCGYVSDRPARFCRQCGTPLFAESEASQATTRNYAPQQAPPTHSNQSATPPPYTPYQYIQSDQEQTPETTRFYRPPAVPEYQAVVPPPPPKRSRVRMILLIALLCLLFIGGGLTMLIVSFVGRNAEGNRSFGDRIERRVRERVEEEMARAAEEIGRQTEQARRQAEDAARNTPGGAPPPPPLPPGAVPTSLEQYKYPGAQITQAVSALGNDVVKMTTADSVDKVKEHYRKQLGTPVVENRDADGQKVIFQSNGAPAILVMIQPDEDDAAKTAINIVRSRFPLPKMN